MIIIMQQLAHIIMYVGTNIFTGMERNTVRGIGHLALHCDPSAACVRACEGSLDWPSVYFSSTKDGFTTAVHALRTHTTV